MTQTVGLATVHDTPQLRDGELAGLWRPEKKGRRLVVDVEPFRRLPRRTGAAIEAEAALAAAHRGCATAEVRL